MNLVENLNKFLVHFLKKEKPFLLGLSGGPDSMALFYLLLKLQKKDSFKFAVAHINHNWREESANEATILKKLVENANISFHELNLNPKSLKGNLEAACRNERLNFFREICKSFDYQGVILGHHFNDQSETVLKRLFEGAFITNLSGLKKVTCMEGLILFRPFLNVKKSEIEKWLIENNKPFFRDSSNENIKYTRAKFRKNIIPFLNEQFGKKIEEPLYRLSIQVEELKDYLNHAFISHMGRKETGIFGSYFDFQEMESLFEIKYMIRSLVQDEDFSLSFDMIDQMAEFIKLKGANKLFIMQGRKLIIDRNKLFILKKDFVDYDLNLDVDTDKCGVFKDPAWEVTLQKDELNKILTFPSWQNFFKGEVQVKITKGQYKLVNLKNQPFSKKHFNLNSLWTKAKVPAFLSPFAPLLLKSESLYAEFLTGKILPINPIKGESYILTLKLKRN